MIQWSVGIALYIISVTISTFCFDLNGISTPNTYGNLFAYVHENFKSKLEQIKTLASVVEMLQLLNWCKNVDINKKIETITECAFVVFHYLFVSIKQDIIFFFKSEWYPKSCL